MKHPMTPCPEHMKPLFAAVRADIAGHVASSPSGYDNMPVYICFTIDRVSRDLYAACENLDSCRDLNQAWHDALVFIDKELEGANCLGSWLIDHDDDEALRLAGLDSEDNPVKDAENYNAEIRYENQCRLAWLDFLTGDNGETSTVQVP